MNNFDKLVNQAAFDNFDPDNFDNNNVQSDLYDPDFATGDAGGNAATSIKNARPGSKLQLSITINNATLSNLTAELFSGLDSCTTRKKAAYATGNYDYIPLLSYQGIQATIANPTGGKTVGYDQGGNLIVRGGVGDPVMTIGCSDYPYNSLVQSTITLPLYVAYIRYTVSTDAQIDNQIENFTRTFGGAETSNRVSPRAYFKPNQYQNKTIDILAAFEITAESGLRILVNSGELLRLALFVQRWAKPSV